MSWRVANSLKVLIREVNLSAPGRSTSFDGTIGDTAHAARTSDHNPYIKDKNGKGVVRAWDCTHDPGGGLDAGRLAEHVRLLGKSGDPRVRYVIYNWRIASPKNNWAWRPYSGPNGHKSHVHISVVENEAYDSTEPWGWYMPQERPKVENMALSAEDIQRIAHEVDKALVDDFVARDKIRDKQFTELNNRLKALEEKVGQ